MFAFFAGGGLERMGKFVVINGYEMRFRGDGVHVKLLLKGVCSLCIYAINLCSIDGQTKLRYVFPSITSDDFVETGTGDIVFKRDRLPRPTTGYFSSHLTYHCAC